MVKRPKIFTFYIIWRILSTEYNLIVYSIINNALYAYDLLCDENIGFYLEDEYF